MTVAEGVDIYLGTDRDAENEAIAREQLQRAWVHRHVNLPHGEFVVEGPVSGKIVRSVNWFYPDTPEVEAAMRAEHMASREQAA
jgi:hypothetical protein